MPIKGVQSERLDERASAFFDTAKSLCGSKAFAHLDFECSLQSFQIVTECYFYLSEAYKPERIPLTSKTRFAKIAAMTACAIGYVKPIRAPSLEAIEDEEYLYVNGVLAMRLGCGLVDHRFDKRPFDDRRRWYRMLQGISFPSLEPLIRDANANKGCVKSVYAPQLTEDELCKIDSFVESFELMALLGDHDASFR